MAEYRISGVWKDKDNIITHYAFHLVGIDSISRASKKTKAEAIKLLEGKNTVITWIWNYSTSYWKKGATVEVINGANGQYLRSDPNNKKTDNLAHLIDYDWIFK